MSSKLILLGQWMYGTENENVLKITCHCSLVFITIIIKYGDQI